jgi:3-deoxy-D-arabino-heptulosonate 7-phosphate (DAHP) synthase
MNARAWFYGTSFHGNLNSLRNTAKDGQRVSNGNSQTDACIGSDSTTPDNHRMRGNTDVPAGHEGTK